MLKNAFAYVETWDVNVLDQLPSKPLIHQRDFYVTHILDIFTFTCCSISIPLYPIFKDIASLCLLHK